MKDNLQRKAKKDENINPSVTEYLTAHFILC